MRTFRPSSRILNPTRAGLLQRVQTSMTLEILIDASRSISPACLTCCLALLCVLIMFTPSISTRFCRGYTKRTLPFLPLSLPAMTRTLSSFRIFIFLPYNTSGASDRILVKSLSRNSLATGPKIRVPFGLFFSVRITAALSSKRM